MARFGLLAIAIILAVSLQQAIALKCWNCDQTTPGCADPFDKNKVPQSMYKDCIANLLGGPACVKGEVKETGHVVRRCAENKAAAALVCQIGAQTMDFCETCESDGCNSASQYGAVATMIAIPVVVIMKMLAI